MAATGMEPPTCTCIKVHRPSFRTPQKFRSILETRKILRERHLRVKMIDDEDDSENEKPRNAQEGANCLSLLTFWYTIPIFRQGAKREFEEADLTAPLEEHKSSILGDKLEELWVKEEERASRERDLPNLLKVLLKMLLKPVIIQGIMLFIMEVPIRLCQPLCLGLLLKYYSTENQHKLKMEPYKPLYILRLFSDWDAQGPISKEEAYFFAAGIVFCSLVNVMVVHPSLMSVMHTGMKMRVAACSLIYRKTLRLDIATMSGPVVGNVVTLMSNDVNRFDLAIMYFHYLWIAPVQMLIALMLMYAEVGIASVVGISAILAVIPLQAWFGNRTSRFRLRTAYRTDERVRQMNEIIQGMQVIKMYTWEYAFVQQIHELRSREIVVLKQTSYIRGAIMSFIMFTTRFAIFLTVVGLVQKGSEINAERVFVVTAYYMILRQTMTLFFPYAIAQVAEINVAITRILIFLMMPEYKSKPDKTDLESPQRSMLSAIYLSKNTSRRPSVTQNPYANPKIELKDVSAKIGEEVCIHNVSITLERGDHAAVIGPVGAGKSSLLNVILGEMQPCLGRVRVNGVVSFASQEPWLFAGSVRQNILFGKPYERQRYNAVVKACALVRDFQLLPYGDQTIVGEKGASLSGGQRARINLARAVYKEADIYLLDDPLSAVDANVGKHLFEICFTHYLKDKIVILVTHQLQFLSEMKKVILMHEGAVEAQGTYHFLETTGLDFAEFLRNQLSVDAEDQIDAAVPLKTRVESIMKDLKQKSSMSVAVIDKEGKRYKPQQVAEMRTEGSVGCGLYCDYFKAGGNCCVAICVIVLFITAQAFASGADYFLACWVDVEERRFVGDNATDLLLGDVDKRICIGIYSAIIFLTMIVALVRSFVFFTVCMRASVNLHNLMFRSIITASMAFFNTNTSGRILNRFSKDMGAVDELLPNAMIDCTQVFLNLVAAAVVITTVNYYLAVPTAIVCVWFYLIRRYYIKTSTSVKRVEGISRSPVFAHLNATMQGLITIRSNGAETILIREFDQLQDDHSSAWFMFIATSRAFGFFLDLVCAFYVSVVTFSFTIFPSSGGNIGLAITTAIGLTGLFQWGMRQSAEMENQMTSVERILEYTRVEHEPDLQSQPDKKPPEEWPPDGNIQFQDVVMRYKPTDPPVLKSLNLKINPKEKIGIAGRTGAGKSSLIAALFRLAPFEGAVVIDEIDTHDIGLHDLRKKISIIPQEPILFSGTLRYNMDPFHNYDDDTVFAALMVVENKAAVTSGIDCLNAHVSEGGDNISVGERQMICLARAVLRNNKVLVLDEATANIDPQTDKFIQTTIREKFSQCTVLTIAHRLHTIMDSDRVLVMDAGIAVEFDHPHTLLQNRTGHFASMVEKTGKAMEKNLRDIAKQNYEVKTRQGQSSS